MGVVCSQALGKLGKHSVSPENDVIENYITPNSVSSRDTIDNIRRVKPAPEAQSIIAIEKSPKPSSHVAAITQIKSKQSPESSNRANSCSDIFTNNFKSPHRGSSSIDTNSILFRSNDSYTDHRQFKRSASVDSSQSNKSSERLKSAQHFSVNQFELCKPKEILSMVESPRSLETKPNSNLSKVCRRFGGSFQTLINNSNSNSNKTSVKSFSVSENNLSALSVSSKRRALSPKRYSTNSDYCPSVLFNRIANKRNEERNWTLNKWKNYFRVNVLRKKKDTNLRKRLVFSSYQHLHLYLSL